MFSPTGYYAHYTTRLKKADRARGASWIDTFPVIGYTDVALILDSGGNVRTVEAVRETLAEECDDEGETYQVSLDVNTWNGESR